MSRQVDNHIKDAFLSMWRTVRLENIGALMYEIKLSPNPNLNFYCMIYHSIIFFYFRKLIQAFERSKNAPATIVIHAPVGKE